MNYFFWQPHFGWGDCTSQLHLSLHAATARSSVKMEPVGQRVFTFTTIAICFKIAVRMIYFTESYPSIYIAISIKESNLEVTNVSIYFLTNSRNLTRSYWLLVGRTPQMMSWCQMCHGSRSLTCMHNIPISGKVLVCEVHTLKFLTTP